MTKKEFLGVFENDEKCAIENPIKTKMKSYIRKHRIKQKGIHSRKKGQKEN